MNLATLLYHELKTNHRFKSITLEKLGSFLAGFWTTRRRVPRRECQTFEVESIHGGPLGRRSHDMCNACHENIFSFQKANLISITCCRWYCISFVEKFIVMDTSSSCIMLARISINIPCKLKVSMMWCITLQQFLCIQEATIQCSLMMHTSTWLIYMLRLCRIVLFSLFKCATSRRDTSLHPNYLLGRYNQYSSANRIFAIVVPWSLARH